MVELATNLECSDWAEQVVNNKETGNTEENQKACLPGVLIRWDQNFYVHNDNQGAIGKVAIQSETAELAHLIRCAFYGHKDD